VLSELVDQVLQPHHGVERGGAEVRVPQDRLYFHQGHLRIAGQPGRGGVPQVVQGPVRAQEFPSSLENSASGPIGQRPARPPAGAPYRQVVVRQARLVEVGGQIGQRLRRDRDGLPGPAPL
jgi:hypothetical protein